ncbi:foldase protein PrsA 1 [Abditibacteriota bacterium]|nr:foldase protein PrsA 1 [Abditibacteriota bacterium]
MNRFLLALALAGVSSPAWAQNQLKPVAAPNAKPPAPATPAPAGGFAAEVNGDKIPLDDLNRIVDSIKAGDPGLQTDSPTAQKALADIKGQMLDQLISTRLLAQEAKRKKIVVAPAKIDDALAKLKTNFKTDADFQNWLQADHKTVADVKRAITDELSIRELSTQLTADITISTDDVAAYYRAHPDVFKVPETVSARHIMLALNPNASPADKDAVKKRADNLLKQAKAKNANFAALAKANSDDTTSKDLGGDMGSFARGEMIQAIEDACFNANVKVGDIVGPVTTEFGLHIIRIDAKTPESTVPLKDVQNDPQLKALLLKQKVQARLDERIAKLRTDAKIQKYV